MTAKKWSEIRARKFTPEELSQIDQEVESELLEMDLRALREAVGLTQGELAQRVDVTQSQLSKMERREDQRISTLRRYVEALGGIWRSARSSTAKGSSSRRGSQLATPRRRLAERHRRSDSDFRR
jgi:transcriptional regulator with XRE-family HTH domain